MTNGYGYIVIETPFGAPIYVDGVLVGHVSAPVTDKGAFKIDSEPRGAKIHLKKTAGYVYHGLTPQTLTLPAGPVPYILRLEKAEYEYTYDLIYIPPGETLSKTYHLERAWAEEPEIGKEPTASVTIRSSPPAELWMYMEGAEGFVSYGMTPKTLTLKATRGMWVAMPEAKKARAEGRVSGEEAARLDAEIAHREEMIRLAKEAYDEAKAARVEAEELLRTFQVIYNAFLTVYNSFLSRYGAFTTRYNALAGRITSLTSQYNAASEDAKPDLAAQLAAAQGEQAAMESEKAALEAEKASWDADLSYWSDMLKYYEERVQMLREYEDQMKDEYEEAKVRARAPYWMVTPGLLGTTWRLKLTKEDYQEVVDKFTLAPGGTYAKDYALVKALDLTTPESLAPFIEDTPPPTPPEMPFAHTWLYIVCFDPNIAINAVWYGGAEPPIKSGGAFLDWHKKNYQAIGAVVCGNPNSPKEECKGKFLKVPPGTHTFYLSIYKRGVYGHWMKRQSILKYKLSLAPGETRYITAEYTAAGITTGSGLCPFGEGQTWGEQMEAEGKTLCGRPRAPRQGPTAEELAITEKYKKYTP